MRMITLFAAALAVLSIASPVDAATTLVSENFEAGYGAFTPSGNVYLTNGNTLIACCGATGTAANMSNTILAFGGGNAPSGSISTAPLTLLLGQTYVLTFDYGAFGNAGLSETLYATIGGNTFSVTPIVNDNFDTNRTTVSFSFVGTGTSSALSFTSSGGAFVDSFVDNVTLSAVPEPATWTMVLLGFAGIGAAMRLSRKRVAALA